MNYHRFIIRTERNRQACQDAIAAIEINPEHPLQVEIKPYTKHRSLSQNRLFHMWVRELSDGYEDTGGERHSPEVWKQYLKNLFLGHTSHQVMGQIVETQVGTSDLNTAEFAAFLERVDHYASTLGVQLTHPDDLWLEAIGG